MVPGTLFGRHITNSGQPFFSEYEISEAILDPTGFGGGSKIILFELREKELQERDSESFDFGTVFDAKMRGSEGLKSSCGLRTNL